MRPALGATGLALLAVLVVHSTAAAGSILPQIDCALEAWRSGEITRFPLALHRVETAPGVSVAVKGKKERREIRRARWAALLDGDRARTLEDEGFPTYRYVESAAGIRTEIWIYPERSAAYIFQDGVLVDVRGS